MIELSGVCLKAGEFSLENISLAIRRGECHAIVGPTGSGKTLLLETIIGSKRHFKGKIMVEGRDISNLLPHERNFSYVPQDICLFPHMTVLENVMYALDIRKLSSAGDRAFAEKLIEFLNIGHLLSRYPKNLSGGEKQRAAIVRALAYRPDLLVLDEPFSAIDTAMREETRRLIKRIHEEFKITSLMVTHDFDEAYFLGDAISVLIGGAIIQSGPSFDIYNYPKKSRVAAFLGVKNIFSGVVCAVEEKKVTVEWPGAGGAVNITCGCAQSKFRAGGNISWGIRSEAVYILRHHNNSNEKPNAFEVTVKKLYTRGKMHTAIVEAAGAAVLEIDIHDAAARKVGLIEGARIKISMNPDNIFILEN